MGINDSFDRLVGQKQQDCDHYSQDKVTTPQGTFCGNCGKTITINRKKEGIF